MNITQNTAIINIQKVQGNEKLAFALFMRNQKYNSTLIPDFLQDYISVKTVCIKAIDTVRTYQIAIELSTKEGKEYIQTEVRVKDGIIDDITVNDMHYNAFVIAYEYLAETLNYNIWWKANADTTLRYKDGKFYDLAPILQAQLCTEQLPLFLNAALDALQPIKDGWLYKVSWQKTPLQANNYQGYWVRYGDNDFNYLNMSTESAQQYNVVDEKGNILGSLLQYYRQLDLNLV